MTTEEAKQEAKRLLVTLFPELGDLEPKVEPAPVWVANPFPALVDRESAEAIAKWSGILSKLQGENAALKNEVAKLRDSRITHCEHDLLKNDLEFYKAVAKQRNEDVAFYRSKKIEIENELRRVRVDDVDRLAREVSDLRSTLDSAYAEIFELRALNDTQADTIEDLKELVDTIEDDLKNAKDDLSYFEGRVIRCPTCSGRGKVTRPEPTQCPGGEGFAPQLWQCPACSGRGKIAINDGKIEGYNG